MSEPDCRITKQELLLEEEMARLEGEISDKYYQLGKSVYEATDRKMDEINHLVDRLVETKLRLTNMKNLCLCVYCMAENPMNNSYCGKCGRELETGDE